MVKSIFLHRTQYFSFFSVIQHYLQIIFDMKKTFIIITLAVMAMAVMPFQSFAQQKTVPEQVTKIFSTASSLEAQGVWSRVLDAKGSLLGYVAYSKPASNGIQGFNGETPLMIIFDAKKTIRKVVLLDNDETPNFVSRVENGGLFDAWNGMTIDQALDAKVDAISGATFTSNGVKQSLQACLQNLKKNVPQDDASTLSCCTWCIVGGAVLLLAVICVVVVVARKRRRK